MSEIEVKLVELAPMRVLSAVGFGESPEGIAIEAIQTYATQHDLLQTHPRFFGFNNPNPSPGSPNYGYEFWMTVGPEVQGQGEITVKEHPGGRFAVTRVKGVENIYPAWQELVAWVEQSSYHISAGECLEEQVSVLGASLDELTLDLYLPIE